MSDSNSPDTPFIRLDGETGERTDEQTNGHTERQSVATDAEDIEWREIWDEFNIRAGKPLSLTQLNLALEVSEQTGDLATVETETLARDAVKCGLLDTYRTDADGRTLGFNLPPQWRGE